MAVKGELKQQIQVKNGVNFLKASLQLDAASIKDIAYQLKGEHADFVGIFGGIEGEKCSLTIIISESVVESKKLDAGKIIREISKHIQGGGGGQAFFATAGGKNSTGIGAALEAFEGMI
jgi:alanyl-tRNA synthetase